MKFPKKSLGQNFLIEKNVIKKILNLLNLEKKMVIEIGPVKGALTDEILKAKPKSLVIIEKDKQLTKFLSEKYSLIKNIKIINADILKVDFKKINTEKNILIGNLPYNVFSNIMKILKYKKLETKFSDLIFMFQKE